MPSKLLTDRQYSNFVAAVAILNNCRLVDIDFSRQVIDMEGPLTDIHACYSELESILGPGSCGPKGKEDERFKFA